MVAGAGEGLGRFESSGRGAWTVGIVRYGGSLAGRRERARVLAGSGNQLQSRRSRKLGKYDDRSHCGLRAYLGDDEAVRRVCRVTRESESQHSIHTNVQDYKLVSRSQPDMAHARADLMNRGDRE